MKNIFLVANWKSNLTTEQAKKWFDEEANIEIFITRSLIMHSNKPIVNEAVKKNVEVIVCPPFTLLSTVKSYLSEKKLTFKVGAQDVSPFDIGPYTGEISAKQIKEFADYVIIGHSERRTNFAETDSQLTEKVKLALQYQLTPIFCIQDENTFIPENVTLVAYEPPHAIGTGNPDSPENAERIAAHVINNHPQIKNVLYGGSVTSENIASYVNMKHLSGALIGGASLDPDKFAAILKLASE